MKLIRKLTISLSILSLLAFTPAHAENYPINELPMYGGQHQPDVPANKQASEHASSLGWQYFEKGDTSTAIKRFNQAWLLDKDNADAYRGFGVIMGERARSSTNDDDYKQAIKHFETAISKKPDNISTLLDLALTHVEKGMLLKSRENDFQPDFKKARKLYEKIENIDPNDKDLYPLWTILELNAGKCKKAKELSHKAAKLGVNPNVSFKKALEECQEK